MATTENPVAIIGSATPSCPGCPRSQRPTSPSQPVGCRRGRGIGFDAVSGINIQVHHYPPPDTGAIVRELGITDVRWSVEGGLGVGALARAAQIVDAGICDAVVVCKIMNTIAPVNVPDIDPETGGVGGTAQFESPTGSATPCSASGS